MFWFKNKRPGISRVLSASAYIHSLFYLIQDVQKDLVSAWLDHLTSVSRAAQLLPKDSSLLSTLEETLSRYLKDVKRTVLKTDKRYSKTCVRRPLKTRQNKDLNNNW